MAAVIAVSLVATSVIPGIALVSNAYTNQAAQDKNKVDVQLTVIFAYAQAGSTQAEVWVKNTGLVGLAPSAIDQSTVFFGRTGAYQMLALGAGPPSWDFSFVNDSVGSAGELNPGQTMALNITSAQPLGAGSYYFQITTYVGNSFDYTFSV